MKVLIASLQVSESGSKGHLHPAVELALETKRRGHEVAILPIPSRLGEEDSLQLSRAGIETIPPPLLPKGVLKTSNELGRLAADPIQVHRAYSSFLLEPIPYQKIEIEEILKKFKPDVILYDLLVYSVPLIGRSLGIPDVGYCAGLKLIAPESLLGSYASVVNAVESVRSEILHAFTSKADFHHLELLSKNGQFVFAPKSLFPERPTLERLIPGECFTQFKTIFAGAIPISKNRSDQKGERFTRPQSEYVVLSFGSVLDPVDFPDITQAVIEATKTLGLRLIIGSKKMMGTRGLPSHVTVFEYLPLSLLIGPASATIHHGGASLFSEAIGLGAKQIMIPLTTDQPIQAYFLKKWGAGIVIKKNEVSVSFILSAITRLRDKDCEFQPNLARVRDEYTRTSGATVAVKFLEDLQRGGGA